MNNVHVIRESVIQALRSDGHSVIEATDIWDRVYSIQFFKAQPGHTFTWLIGNTEIEFTKIGNSPVTTTETIEQPDEPRGLGKLLPVLLVVGVICIALVVIAANGG